MLTRILTAGLNVSLSRFYAHSIGSGIHKCAKEALDDLKRWFNAAFTIHVIILVLIGIIGYPLGEYAIKNWLTIPELRIDASVWVFRFSVITILVSFFSAPFVSMITAFQRIYLVTIFEILRSMGVCVIAYILLHANGDRLISYALYMMCLGLLIQGALIITAVRIFPACRIHLAFLHEWRRLRELLGFTSWKLFGKGSLVLREQGTPIVVNIYFGPLGNAAYALAITLFSKANLFSLALNKAFQPAVVSAEGAGDRHIMLIMAMRVCKFGSLLVMAFSIPAILEMHNLLNVWLGGVPHYAAEICQWLLAALIADRLTGGHGLAINAGGKIRALEILQGFIVVTAIPVIAALFSFGCTLNCVGVVFFTTTILYCTVRVVLAKQLVNFPLLAWLRKVALPVVFLLLLCFLTGCIICYVFDASLLRILITSSSVITVMTIGAWITIFDREEKRWIQVKAQSKLKNYAFVRN